MSDSTKNPVDEYDQAHGRYESNVPRDEKALEKTLPIPALPQGPQPSPVKIRD